jgi:aminopeptidase N
MKKHIGILLFALLPLIAPAQTLEHLERFFESEAQKNNELLRGLKLTGTQVTPNQEQYDVYFYSLDLIVNPVTIRVHGKVMIYAHALSDLDSMELNYSSYYEVQGIYLAEYPDSVLAFQHQTGIIDIKLDKAYSEGEEIKILVEFTSRHINGILLFGQYQGSDMVFNYNRGSWFPCKFTPGDKSDSTDMRVTVPGNLVVASNGLLKDISHTDTSSTYFWQERYPIAPYLIFFAAYPYEIHTDWYVRDNNDSMMIQMFTIPNVYEQVKDHYAKEKDMLGYYEEHFGPYPYFQEKYGHAEINHISSTSYQTMTGFQISRLLEDNPEPEIIITHELAHSWMGNSVTTKSWHHVWIIEGFATYATAIWFDYNEDEDILGAIMELFEYYGSGTPYVENPETEEIFHKNLSYRKSAWVYHMLRHIVGDSVFFSIIKAITSDPSCAHGTITTERLVEIAESVSGMNLEKFFQQWIFGEYYPDYAYSWTYSEKEAGYELELTVQQVQVGQLFWMPVDVAIETLSGVESFVIWDSLETQVFHFELDELPQSVTLDPDNWVLNNAKDVTGTKEFAKHETEILVVPNPFKNKVEFKFELRSNSYVSLLIFNELGQEVANLTDGIITPGTHSISWDAKGFRTGMYFYRFKSGEGEYTGKLILAE